MKRDGSKVWWMGLFSALMCGPWSTTYGKDLLVSDRAIVNTGYHVYQAKCAVCHGDDAAGNGPFANLITVAPPDLTVLSRQNAGEFPFWPTYEVISGNELMPAHGGRHMPIWGQELTEDPAADGHDAQALVRGRIFALLAYLMHVQKK